MATIEQAQERLRLIANGTKPAFFPADHAQAILDELARLRGEEQRTVYVESDGPKGAISEALAGFSFLVHDAPGLKATHAVTLTARKAQP